MTRKRTSENDLVVSATGGNAPTRRKAATRPRAKRVAEQVEPLAIAAPKPESVAPQADAGAMPSYEAIAILAYSYWEARGCQGGCAEEDWTRAEQELRNRASSVAVA